MSEDVICRAFPGATCFVRNEAEKSVVETLMHEDKISCF